MALAIIAILLVSSSIVLLNVANTASALTQDELLADDMYGWPIGPGYDSGNTFFNPGPGPNRPDVLWTARRPDNGGSLSGAPCVAFDGKIFAYASGHLFAFDPFTGANIWDAETNHGNPRGFGTATFFKVADGYIGYEVSSGIVVHRTSDGQEVGWIQRDSDMYGNHGGGSVIYWGGFYSSWDMKKYTTALATAEYADEEFGIKTPVHLAIAYDLSDPENPTLAWTWPAPTGIEAMCGAPGLAIFGGYGEGELYALNATTGELVWKQYNQGNAGYIANYWDGKIYHSASSTTLSCYDAETGDIIFEQFEGPRAFFVFGDAIAYNRYLCKNIALPNGWVGAYDAFTGAPLWKSPALYNIAYLIPVVADGKIYCQRYQGTAGGEEAQTNTFACWDAFTGQILWEMPGVSFAEPMIAYGHLYAVSGGTLYCIGESDKPFSMFHGFDGEDISMPGIQDGRSGPADISYPTWTYDTGSEISGSAVAGDGKVYFGTLDGEVLCLDAFTGQQVWSFPLGFRMASTPALVGDRLYIGPDDGNIYCLNADTGEEIWKRDAGGLTYAFWISAWQVRSSPIVVNSRLYVGSLDGNLYCVNTANGNVVWKAMLGGDVRPPGGTPLVVEELGLVFISSSNSELYAVDMDDGSIVWETVVQPTSGFDDRAMVSTPVWDDGTLWMVVDTWMLARFNATTGEFMNQAQLPYSARTGTMTPAITTPAIKTTGNSKTLIVGDGFQMVAFDITRFDYDPMLFVNATQGSRRTVQVWYRGPPENRVNSTTANNVNEENRGNESYIPIINERWLGHQVYSSPVVADEMGTYNDKIYFGDDVNSITVINATGTSFNSTDWGTPLSVYTTKGQVFASACLYEGWLYMGSQDGVMYAFTTTWTVPFSIVSAANKQEMWNNETLTVEGRLQPTVHIDPETGLGSYETNAVPGLTVKLSVTLPDGSDSSQETTCDDDGYFTFNYNPTQTGDYGWVAYFEGDVKPRLAYLAANGEFTPLTVNSPTTGGGSQPPPEQTGEGIPIEYIYVAVAVIVIVIVALAVYFLFRGRK